MQLLLVPAFGVPVSNLSRVSRFGLGSFHFSASKRVGPSGKTSGYRWDFEYSFDFDDGVVNAYLSNDAFETLRHNVAIVNKTLLPLFQAHPSQVALCVVVRNDFSEPSHAAREFDAANILVFLRFSTFSFLK